VSVIDSNTRAVTDTVAVGAGPRTVAADPSTHTAWVVNFAANSISVLERWGPGSYDGGAGCTAMWTNARKLTLVCQPIDVVVVVGPLEQLDGHAGLVVKHRLSAA
jgi:DNA-binding beta-propeller fold protein YncE